ncbi:hypothetical protein CHARACLAT_024430 [Characodon lateralis]|uniref:Uncharacterized protein n=1 Tax=Characodon lateralis TaxID=208331 RepID=A0ABU7EWD0_9TELE|nr:hypothetical protein [Characodon lateralis]
MPDSEFLMLLRHWWKTSFLRCRLILVQVQQHKNMFQWKIIQHHPPSQIPTHHFLQAYLRDFRVRNCKRDGKNYKPGVEDVIEEYKTEKLLTHCTWRKLVNILASHMTDSHGRMPSCKHKEKYALGIITLFPSLKDPFSPKGYEHFYDAEKGTGYLSWRLKTMSRNAVKRPAKMPTVAQAQGLKR